MTTPEPVLLGLSAATMARLVRLAEVMTADTGDEWSTQDVIHAALGRGLDALELAYLGPGPG